MSIVLKLKPSNAANLKMVPPAGERKKVSVDEGFTAIPNELLEAILGANLTSSEIKLILFVYRKTVGWHKEIDWICDEQIAEGCSFRDYKEANRVKNNLIAREILVKQGRKIGLNLYISMWKAKIQNNSEIRKISENNPKNFGKKSEKFQTTKETITKNKINTPLTPQGGEALGGEIVDENSSAENSAFGENPPAENLAAEELAAEKIAAAEILTQAEGLLSDYNALAGGSCRDASPFVALLTKTKGRDAYAVDDIRLVLKWVLATWGRRNGTAPKPKNICRVNRFDGYLSDAVAWQKNQALFEGVVKAYNEILGGRLVRMESLDALAEKQIQGLLPYLKNPSVGAFVAYFETFAETAKPFYFEPERKFGFSFLMKPETLVKTRRGEL